MILDTLVKGLKFELIQGSLDVEVNDIHNDSRRVGRNDLFFCISGAVCDGHSFVKDVCEKGASVLIVEKEVEAPEGVTVLRFESSRYAMGMISFLW